MYKILKRGYYYGNTHKPEEDIISNRRDGVYGGRVKCLRGRTGA